MEIPEQLQQQLVQHQQLQQQGELVATQRAQMELAAKELEQTLKELDQLGDEETLYRSVGSVMMKVGSKDKLVEQLKEELETNELRVKSLKGQEDLLKEQLTKIQEQVQSQIATLKGAGGPLGS